VEVNSLVVGIETAIGGGSLALFENDVELGSLEGGPAVTRAGELIPNIASLLDSCKVSVSELGTIIVSTGPGSFTGIRVGIATALGLASACAVRRIGLTVMEAIAFTSEFPKVIAAVPMGRDLTCLQSYTNTCPDGVPQLVPFDQLYPVLERISGTPILCHEDAYQLVSSSAPRDLHVVNIGRKLASLLCLSSESRFASDRLDPLFVDRRPFIKI
jgi:tRNA threonylcarbamoyl adenosine modification protein YeaZ